MSIKSTQVGFRIRGIEPAGLSAQPDSVKLMYWGFVLELALKAKDRDLAAGLDKDGNPLKPLLPKSIKYRKSEVGPTFKHAPPLSPGQARSRVRSLLTGRAHTTSAELFWKFDPITGRSFADVLQAQKARGRDVFGLSPAGTAWVRSQALERWKQWASRALPSAAPAPPRRPGLRPIGVIAVRGRTDLRGADLGQGAQLERTKEAIRHGRHTGFRRLGAVGQRWTPGPGVPTGKLPAAPTTVQRQSVERALAVPFRPTPRAAAGRQSVVLADVAAVDESLATRAASYIASGGRGPSVGDSYRRFERSLLEARAARGRAVAMPEAELDEQGRVIITDGRERFAVLRDQGAAVIPVSVPRDQAVEFRLKYGATQAQLRAVTGAQRFSP